MWTDWCNTSLTDLKATTLRSRSVAVQRTNTNALSVRNRFLKTTPRRLYGRSPLALGMAQCSETIEPLRRAYRADTAPSPVFWATAVTGLICRTGPDLQTVPARARLDRVGTGPVLLPEIWGDRSVWRPVWWSAEVCRRPRQRWVVIAALFCSPLLPGQSALCIAARPRGTPPPPLLCLARPV